MRKINRFISWSFLSALVAVLAAGSLAMAADAPAKPDAPAEGKAAIRLNAGESAAHTDEAGNTWLPDQGFDGGDTIDRGNDTEIANTKIPSIYRTEHYSMSGFTYKVPNGKYVVKLHFAETFEEITGPKQRVFSFSVQGHDFKDFDVFAKAGGARRAYIETVNVEITTGKLDITFTSNIENPEINGIEIIPAP